VLWRVDEVGALHLYLIGVQMLRRNMITSKQATEIIQRKKNGETYANIEQAMNISRSKIISVYRLYFQMSSLEFKVYGCLLNAAIDMNGGPGRAERIYYALKGRGYLKNEKCFLSLKEKSDKALYNLKRIGKQSIRIIRRAIDIFETGVENDTQTSVSDNATVV